MIITSKLGIDYTTVTVSSCLGTYTGSNALGKHLSKLVIRNNTMRFRLRSSH